ncbi:MAG: phage tail protein, partial [Candidatus Pacebacteria bacterium]|nr:phage tail protein [Candidatus Paceibacterota bacterium]
SIGTTAQTQTLTVAGTIGATGDICTAVGGGSCLSTAGGGAIDPAPIGSIVSYAGTVAPAGYLICDGSSLLRTAYPALFSAIGTTYGAADATHFNLPDLRGEFIRGFSNGRAGVDVGRVFGSWQADELKSHTHTAYVMAPGGSYAAYSNIAGPQTVTTSATGGSETRPRNVAMNYIIKAVNNSEMVLVGAGGGVTGLTAGTGVTLNPVGPDAKGLVTISATRTRLTAGAGITLSPAGPNATGDVTISATASSAGAVTGGCTFGTGWGTATNCALGAGMSCSAGNTARVLAYAATNGAMQWNGSGTYAHGFCIRN